jgi:hypothetical protein
MFAPYLVVLFEIDTARFIVLEFERDAPWSVDVDRIAFWIEPLQGVKVEAWDVHFFSPDGNVETIEPRENALVHFRIYFRGLALRPQLRKGFALEGPDHGPT